MDTLYIFIKIITNQKIKMFDELSTIFVSRKHY